MAKLNKKKMAESDAADDKSNGGDDVDSSTENVADGSNDENEENDRSEEENGKSDEEEPEKITGDDDADDENDDSDRKTKGKKAEAAKKDKKRKSPEKRKKTKETVDDEDDVADVASEDEEAKEDGDEEYTNGGSAAKKAKKTKPKASGKKGKKAGNAKKAKKAASEDEGVEDDEGNEEDEGSEEAEYEVQDIVGKKVKDGVTYYQIRWKGWSKDDDTWEPADTLSCPDIIERYNKKHANDKPAKAGKPKTPAKAAAKIQTPKKAAGKAKGSKPKHDPEVEYEVEKIIDYAEEKGETLFRIRWKGFRSKDDTWEPESNLNCKDLIEKFMSKMKDQENLSFKELREEPKKTKRLVNETNLRTALHNPIGRKSKRSGHKQRVYYGGDSDE